MTDHTLLPCPFCGGEGAITPHVHHRALQACVCDECSSSSGWYLHEEEAIAAWNRRTPPAAVPDGWVMVPKEPTPEMLDAATPPESEWIGHKWAKPGSFERWRQGHREDAERKYRSMISAAPAAPTDE